MKLNGLTLIFISCLISISASASTEMESIRSLQDAATQACSGNKDQSTCRKLIFGTANFTMLKTLDFIANCANKAPSKQEDAKACKDAESFMDYVHEQSK